jgi:hypothetical protein
MSKVYSFVDLPTPVNLSATPVSGGTLIVGQIYYYKIIGITGVSASVWHGKTKLSDEISATANASNRSIRLQFTSPLVGGSNGFLVFRSTTPNGQLGGGKVLNSVFSNSTVNLAGTVTITDTGISEKSDFNFLENINDSHGILTISGSSSSDRFSIVDLYNQDVAQGWGVIQRLDVNSYKVNCYLVTSGEVWWQDLAKTIIFADGILGSNNFNANFGEISGDQLTSLGCKIVISSSSLSVLTFGALFAYRTQFEYVFPVVPYNSVGFVGCTFNSGIVQDCSVDGFRGFEPVGGLNCTFNNFIMSNFNIAFGANDANYNIVKLLKGSRVFQMGNQQVTARGLIIEDARVALVVNSSSGRLTLIDSVTSLPLLFGTYVANTNFQYFDQFSFNLIVYEEGTTTPIQNATVTISNNIEQVFSVTTNSFGRIVEQFVTRLFGLVSQIEGTTNFSYTERGPYRLVVESETHETYTENFLMPITIAQSKIVSLRKQVEIIPTTNGFALSLDPKLGSNTTLQLL